MKKFLFIALTLTNGYFSQSLLAQNQASKKANDSKEVNQEPKELSPAVQIYFDNNKFEIKKEEAKKLDQLIDRLKSIKEYRLILTGHTDSTGNDDLNLKLSEDRVNEVFDYLVDKDVDQNIMEAKYFGRAKPREKNETDAQTKAKNRRVEITIVEKPKPIEKPKPKIGDTCVRDTTVTLGNGMTMTLNKCDYIRMCKTTPGKCVAIRRTSDFMDIIKSGHPLSLKSNEGLVWASIMEFKFPGDTCLAKPFTATINTNDYDGYKRAKIKLIVKDDKTGKLKVSTDRDKKIQVVKTKESIKYAITVKCPTSKDKEGHIFVAGPAGKGKTCIIKDKTNQIDELYVVQESPTTIIPAEKDGNIFTVKYGKLNDPQFVFKLNDGSYTQPIAASEVKKSKNKTELRKKYKIKAKHIKD